MTIELHESYETERLPNGFSFYAGDRASAAAVFATLCIKMGHRLATEGKEIVDVEVLEHFSSERSQVEIGVRVKIRHRLAIR